MIVEQNKFIKICDTGQKFIYSILRSNSTLERFSKLNNYYVCSNKIVVKKINFRQHVKCLSKESDNT